MKIYTKKKSLLHLINMCKAFHNDPIIIETKYKREYQILQPKIENKKLQSIKCITKT